MRPTLEALEARALPAPLSLDALIASADARLTSTVALLLPQVTAASAGLDATGSAAGLDTALTALRSAWHQLEGPLLADLIIRDFGHPNYANNVAQLIADAMAIDHVLNAPPQLPS